MSTVMTETLWAHIARTSHSGYRLEHPSGDVTTMKISASIKGKLPTGPDGSLPILCTACGETVVM